jgi:hypothetical protein
MGDFEMPILPIGEDRPKLSQSIKTIQATNEIRWVEDTDNEPDTPHATLYKYGEPHYFKLQLFFKYIDSDGGEWRNVEIDWGVI